MEEVASSILNLPGELQLKILDMAQDFEAKRRCFNLVPLGPVWARCSLVCKRWHELFESRHPWPRLTLRITNGAAFNFDTENQTRLIDCMLRFLHKRINKIESLEFGCSEVDERKLAKIMHQAGPVLKRVSFNSLDSPFGPDMADWFRNALYIRELHVASSKPCLEHMPPNLEVAKFSRATRITPQGLGRLSALRNLKVLKLQPYVMGSDYPEVLDCHAHINDLALLSQLVNLEELEIIRVVIYSVPEWFGELPRLKVSVETFPSFVRKRIVNVQRRKEVYLSKFVPHHSDAHFNLHRLAHIQQLKLRFVNEIPAELAALPSLEILMMDTWRSELDFGSLSTCPKLKVIRIDSNRNLASGYMTIKGLEKVPGLEAFQYLPEHLSGDVRIVLGQGGLIKLKEFRATAGAGRLLLEGSPEAFGRLCRGAKKIVISMHDESASDENLKKGVQAILEAARACGVNMEPSMGFGGILTSTHPVLGKGSILQIDNLKQYLEDLEREGL